MIARGKSKREILLKLLMVAYYPIEKGQLKIYGANKTLLIKFYFDVCKKLKNYYYLY